MVRKHLTLIYGNKQDSIPYLKFVNAHATNTRLMGVIAMHVQWEKENGQNFHQFFHFDVEDYGFDNYESFTGDDPLQIEIIEACISGGLGGTNIPLSESEVKHLIHHFVSKNHNEKLELPEPQNEYLEISKENIVLNDADLYHLFEKLCEIMDMPYKAINYFIMRNIGKDVQASNFLSKGINLDYEIPFARGTLLKNNIKIYDNNGEISYICESLLDFSDRYAVIISELFVDTENNKSYISQAALKSTMMISPTEAAFILNRNEYIMVYDIENDVETFIEQLFLEKPQMMKNMHGNGFLFTEFNSTNDHVKLMEYYINNDISILYYITNNSQLVVAAYDFQKLTESETFLNTSGLNSNLLLLDQFEFGNSILYDFVHSEYDDFYDFYDDFY